MGLEPHPTHFLLERLLADELPSVEENQLRVHLESCKACERKLAELRADIQAFQVEIPWPRFQADHAARTLRGASRSRIRGVRSWLPYSLSMAGGLGALMLVLAIMPQSPSPGPDKPLTPATKHVVRSKGTGVALRFAVLEAGRLREGIPGEELGAGQVLQLYYDAGTYSHIALLGIDGQGKVNRLFPDNGSTLAPVAQPSGAFPFSLTLDSTLGTERFFALFAQEALPLAPTLGAAQTLASKDLSDGDRLALPDSYTQATTWVNKD